MDKQALHEVDMRILKCKDCPFHTFLLKEHSLNFRPDAPCNKHLESANYKVLSVGINPGWGNWNELTTKEKYQQLYKEPLDYEKYVIEINKIWDEKKEKSKGAQPFFNALVNTLCLINDKMNIYPGITSNEFKEALYEKYVFRANLSFCNSQKINKRVFWDIPDKLHMPQIPCDVINTEIPNCLKNGFLKDIIRYLKPEYVICFGKYHFMHAKYLMESLTSVKSANIDKWDKNETEKVSVGVCLSPEAKFIFLPHPGSWRFNKYREDAITWACSILNKIN